MATSPGDISLEEAPALPRKTSATRMVTPSPQNYDSPDPNAPYARPPSIHSNQSGSVPGTPSPGYGLIQPFPNPTGSHNGSQPGSRHSSRATTPTIYPSDIQPAMQPLPGMRTISYEGQTSAPAVYGISSTKPPPSMQVKQKKERKPKPQGFQLILASSIILSVITIFINPIFGFIALTYSCMSLMARTNAVVLKNGHIAKYTSVVGMALSLILAIVAGVIIGTNNKGY